MQTLAVGCDAHKHYSQLEVQDSTGQALSRVRVDHAHGSILRFFSTLPKGTPVALESVGNWYWIADEIEQAGCLPLLTNPANPHFSVRRERRVVSSGCESRPATVAPAGST